MSEELYTTEYPHDVSGVNMPPTHVENHHVVQGLRKGDYPDMGEYLDAKVKQQSNDPIMVMEGKQQEADYVKACLATKAKHPRGIVPTL